MTVAQEGVGSIREAAQRLADGNIQNAPDLEAIYWFPAEDIIRLVMLDPITLPSEKMAAFSFGPYPQGGIPYPYAVVLIRPEEKEHLAPPGWGTWEDARRLWPGEQIREQHSVAQHSVVCEEYIKMTVVQESMTNTESIYDAARKLADYNMEVSPDLVGIYLFPAEDTIRLVLLDPVTIPSEEMVPYYFNAFPQGGVAYPSAIVVMRPEEKVVLPPPPDWGSWETAVQLRPKG